MGLAIPAAARTIPRLRQRVWLNGVWRPGIYAMSVEQSASQAATCSLSIPAAAWDAAPTGLVGGLVRVDAGLEGELEQTVFVGVIGSRSGGLPGNRVEAGAVSVMGLAGAAIIGHGAGGRRRPVIEYPRRALRGGTWMESGWSPLRILRDWFSPSSGPTWRGGGGTLSSDFRALIRLGDTRALERAAEIKILGDLAFRSSGFEDGLRILLSYLGGVQWAERFAGGAVYLDFFLPGDWRAASHRVRVARPGEDIAAVGANVRAIDNPISIDEIRDRCIGFGAPETYVITVDTQHLTAPLERDWDSSLEAAILANPDSVKRAEASGATRGQWSAARARVFRRYRLPECLRRLIVGKDLPLEQADGSRLGVQAFVWKAIPTVDPTGEYDYVGVLGAAPTLVGMDRAELEQGYLMLSEPAITLLHAGVGPPPEFLPIITHVEAVVGLTIAIQRDPLAWDTGMPGRPVVASRPNGLVQPIENDSFRLARFGNVGSGFEDGDGATHEFSEALFFAEQDVITDFEQFAPGWNDGAAGGGQIADDRAYLRQFVELALLERMILRRPYSITIPWFAPAYRVGDRIEIEGQADYVAAPHTILSRSLDLTNRHETQLSTDSQAPMIYQGLGVMEGGNDR